MTIFQIAGVIGFLGYVSCFWATQMSLVRVPSIQHSVWNLSSASLVLLSLTENFNLASVMIQISWIVISVMGITIQYRNTRRVMAHKVHRSGRTGRTGRMASVAAGGMAATLVATGQVASGQEAAIAAPLMAEPLHAVAETSAPEPAHRGIVTAEHAIRVVYGSMIE